MSNRNPYRINHALCCCVQENTTSFTLRPSVSVSSNSSSSNATAFEKAAASSAAAAVNSNDRSGASALFRAAQPSYTVYETDKVAARQQQLLGDAGRSQAFSGQPVPLLTMGTQPTAADGATGTRLPLLRVADVAQQYGQLGEAVVAAFAGQPNLQQDLMQLIFSRTGDALAFGAGASADGGGMSSDGVPATPVARAAAPGAEAGGS